MPWRKKPEPVHEDSAMLPDATPAEGSPAQSGTKPPAKDSDGMPAAIKAGIGALGLTAVLAGAGFIGKVALQQFLGVELGNWTTQDLGIFAGKWAIDTVAVVLSQVAAHKSAFILALILYLVPPILGLTLPPEHRAVRIAGLLSTGAATAGLLFVLVWWEMPTLSMNDWLTRDLQEQLRAPGPGLLQESEAELRLTLLVSKMGSLASRNKLNCAVSGQGGSSGQQALPLPLLKHLDSDNPSVTAQDSLQWLYACSVVICLGAWFTLRVSFPDNDPVPIQELFKGTRIALTFVLLPLVSCLIPYTYAKLLYPTSFPVVTLIYTNGDVSPTEMWILDETEKDLLLLPVEETQDTEDAGQYIVQTRHRDEIKRMRFYGNRDVLTTMLLPCRWIPKTGQQGADGN
jgi:hypothetical protein